MTEKVGGVEGCGDDRGALLVRAWIYQGLGRTLTAGRESSDRWQ
jgi:hypothetical protein